MSGGVGGRRGRPRLLPDEFGITLTGWAVAAIVAAFATVKWPLVAAGFTVAVIGFALVRFGNPNEEEA
jgi:hypothetical protein